MLPATEESLEPVRVLNSRIQDAERIWFEF